MQDTQVAKFKVGDKVKVKYSELTRKIFGWDDVEMTDMVGEIHTIEGTADARGNTPRAHYINYYTFTEDALELAESAQEVPQPEEKSYTASQIRAAYEYNKWTDDSFELTMKALKALADPEYQKYLELKAKFEQ